MPTLKSDQQQSKKGVEKGCCSVARNSQRTTSLHTEREGEHISYASGILVERSVGHRAQKEKKKQKAQSLSLPCCITSHDCGGKGAVLRSSRDNKI
jgi:hypothetical protein